MVCTRAWQQTKSNKNTCRQVGINESCGQRASLVRPAIACEHDTWYRSKSANLRTSTAIQTTAEGRAPLWYIYYLAVEMTAGILKMRSRNRSCTSHAKKAVVEGKSFPRRRGAEAAISRSSEATAARGPNCGETGCLMLLPVSPGCLLRDVDARWLSKNPRALAAKNKSNRPNRIQTHKRALSLLLRCVLSAAGRIPPPPPKV